jgi:hypothetical protein
MKSVTGESVSVSPEKVRRGLSEVSPEKRVENPPYRGFSPYTPGSLSPGGVSFPGVTHLKGGCDEV